MQKDDSEIKERFRHIPGNDAKFPIEDFIYFRSDGNEKLWTYKYPADKPAALVIIFHGLHAYCNNYAVMAKCFSEIGCEVVAFDWTGHGKSEGIRGFLRSYASLYNDSCRFICEMMSMYPNLPIYLAGGSLGGAISILAQHQLRESKIIKGLILFSPAVKANVKCEMLATGLAKFISTLAPTLKLSKGDPEKFCPNEEVRRFILENPFIYSDKIRAGTLGTVIWTMQRAAELIPSLDVPFVVIQGGNDKVVDPEVAEALFKNAKAEDKEFWMYSSLSHALLFENEIYEILGRVQDWLRYRIN